MKNDLSKMSALSWIVKNYGKKLFDGSTALFIFCGPLSLYPSLSHFLSLSHSFTFSPFLFSQVLSPSQAILASLSQYNSRTNHFLSQ